MSEIFWVYQRSDIGKRNDWHNYSNLLNEEVLAEAVGKAFLSLVLAKKTTGDIMTVDGGNIQAVLR